MFTWFYVILLKELHLCFILRAGVIPGTYVYHWFYLEDGFHGYCLFWLVTLKMPPLYKKLSFPLGISSVDVTKSTGHCGFGYIY